MVRAAAPAETMGQRWAVVSWVIVYGLQPFLLSHSLPCLVLSASITTPASSDVPLDVLVRTATGAPVHGLQVRSTRQSTRHTYSQPYKVANGPQAARLLLLRYAPGIAGNLAFLKRCGWQCDGGRDH